MFWNKSKKENNSTLEDMRINRVHPISAFAPKIPMPKVKPYTPSSNITININITKDADVEEIQNSVAEYIAASVNKALGRM